MCVCVCVCYIIQSAKQLGDKATAKNELQPATLFVKLHPRFSMALNQQNVPKMAVVRQNTGLVDLVFTLDATHLVKHKITIKTSVGNVKLEKPSRRKAIRRKETALSTLLHVRQLTLKLPEEIKLDWTGNEWKQRMFFHYKSFLCVLPCLILYLRLWLCACVHRL